MVQKSCRDQGGSVRNRPVVVRGTRRKAGGAGQRTPQDDTKGTRYLSGMKRKLTSCMSGHTFQLASRAAGYIWGPGAGESVRVLARARDGPRRKADARCGTCRRFLGVSGARGGRWCR